MIADDYVDLAQSNVENMLYMVERYGKMLNGNRTFFENRSQPPYLSKMVEHIYLKKMCIRDRAMEMLLILQEKIIV